MKQIFTESIRKLPVTFNMIRTATQSDPVLQKVIFYLQHGWPDEVLGNQHKAFFLRRDSLTIVDNCLMLSDRIVIPLQLRIRVLEQFHCGHPGITRMKSVARSYAYWPGIDQEIERMVKSCRNCALAAKAPVKAELHSWPTPSGPWKRIHIDFAGPMNNQYFLVIVDAYSKWPEIIQMKEISTSITVSTLNHLFSQFGIPETVVSDNGTQFTSGEFSEFCSSLTIQHVRSPIYHPQSNGQAERFVDTFKRALRKLQGEGSTSNMLDIFLRTYRSTPNASTPNQTSPAEAFLGRRMRVTLDAMLPSERPKLRNPVMESQFNRRHGAKMKDFKPGDLVYVHVFRNFSRTWIPGIITKRKGNVIYEVAVGNTTQTRHVNHLRSRCISPCPAQGDISELPLDIMLDTFALPNTTASDTEKLKLHVAPTERRYSLRTRPPIKRFSIDPSKRSYW